jgi:hypothetical protein
LIPKVHTVARDFSASVSYLSVSNGSLYNLTSAWSIQCWVYFDTIVTNGYLVNHQWSGGGIPCVIGISDSAIFTAGKLFTGYYDGGNWRVTGDTAATPATGAWIHIVGTYDGTNVVLYKNGAQVATSAPGGAPGSAGTNAFTIGKHWNNDIHPDGRIGEVAVWNTALKAGEIAALAAGIRADTIRSTALKGYWPVLAAGTIEPDYSGQAQHMNVNGTLNAGAHPPVGPFVIQAAPQQDQLGAAAPILDSATVSLKLTPSATDVAALTESATVLLDIVPGIALPVSGGQWVKLIAGASGQSCVGMDNDVNYTSATTEAWYRARLQFSSALLAAIPSANYSGAIFVPGGYLSGGDYFHLGVRNNGSNIEWSIGGGAGFGTVLGDTWYYVEVHLDTGAHTYQLMIDGTIVSSGSYSTGAVPFGLNTVEVLPAASYLGTTSDKYVGVDDLAYSLLGWSVDGPADLTTWDFSGATPLVDAWNNYPSNTPPRYVCTDPANTAQMVLVVPVSTDATTVPISLLPITTAEVPNFDGSTVYEDIQPSSVQLFGAIDAASVRFSFSVQGGECYSTAQIGVEGEADALWFALANRRWTADADTRWFADARRTGVPC